METRIRRGLDLPFQGVPGPLTQDSRPIRSVGLMPADHPGLRVRLAVKEGERVRRGQPLFVDHSAPEVCFTSPRAGTVARIHLAEQQIVQAVVVAVDGDELCSADAPDPDAWEHEAEVRRRLLAAGLWPALRSRPLGRIPHPRARADAVFVTVMDTNPLAGSIDAVLPPLLDDFARGTRALATLTEGTVHVCAGGRTELPEFDHARVRVSRFTGLHPAGLVGTHMQRLARPGRNRACWYVGWQDVVAIGRFAGTGAPPAERLVALGGPGVIRPRWLRTVPGASVEDIVNGELLGGPCRAVSGSLLSGRQASGWGAYLGRYHTQVSVLPEPIAGVPARQPRSFSFHRFLRRWRRPQFVPDTALRGRPAPMIPLASFERVVVPGILPTPLLRALLVGDLDTAERLGCLELEEEDLALCTFLCPSKIDYGTLLRRALNELADALPEGKS